MSSAEAGVIVVGGGIGGLSTALALRRAGIPVTVLERSTELREVGAGVQIWTNGMEALDRLGLADEVAGQGEPVERMSFTNAKATELVQLSVQTIANELGVRLPAIVRRPDLLRTLARALGDDVVRLDAGCVGFEQDPEGVTVRLADGREERGALLVGADGADSIVRETWQPEAKPRFAGYQYLRALCDVTDPRVPMGTFRFMFGRADRFGIHPGVYWFGVIVTPPGTSDSEAGRRQDLLDRFGRFAEPVPSLIASVPEEAIGRTDIRDLDPLERWVDGRVVLLGDAAHATTPNLGRGASEAIEDAVALADCLTTGGTLDDGPGLAGALAEFERLRRSPTARIQSRARQIGKVASWRNPIACAIRGRFMRIGMGRAMARETREEFEALASSPRSGQRVLRAEP